METQINAKTRQLSFFDAVQMIYFILFVFVNNKYMYILLQLAIVHHELSSMKCPAYFFPVCDCGVYMSKCPNTDHATSFLRPIQNLWLCSIAHANFGHWIWFLTHLPWSNLLLVPNQISTEPFDRLISLSTVFRRWLVFPCQFCLHILLPGTHALQCCMCHHRIPYRVEKSSTRNNICRENH